MQPFKQELVRIQDEIREYFDWSLEADYKSALLLLESCKNPAPSILLEGKVTVVGAAVNPGYIPQMPTLVADGAIGAIEDYSKVVLIVSDGDGSPYIEKALNKGIPICLHAHGDNIETWQNILSAINEKQQIMLTHQTPEKIEGMHNPGGFTDGDRAVCIAFALGATEVELVGFSTDEVGRWSGATDEKRKLMKLKWMNRVLELLSLEVSR